MHCAHSHAWEPHRAHPAHSADAVSGQGPSRAGGTPYNASCTRRHPRKHPGHATCQSRRGHTPVREDGPGHPGRARHVEAQGWVEGVGGVDVGWHRSAKGRVGGRQGHGRRGQRDWLGGRTGGSGGCCDCRCLRWRGLGRGPSGARHSSRREDGDRSPQRTPRLLPPLRLAAFSPCAIFACLLRRCYRGPRRSVHSPSVPCLLVDLPRPFPTQPLCCPSRARPGACLESSKLPRSPLRSPSPSFVHPRSDRRPHRSRTGARQTRASASHGVAVGRHATSVYHRKGRWRLSFAFRDRSSTLFLSR